MTTDVAPVAGVVTTSTGFEWLILPDESTATYTNYGDGREGDASSLVGMVNVDPALNQGHTDWRLPRLNELKLLIESDQNPNRRWYWSSSPHASGLGALVIEFASGYDFGYTRNSAFHVRLVRKQQGITPRVAIGRLKANNRHEH